MKYFVGTAVAAITPVLSAEEQILLSADDVDAAVPAESIVKQHIEWAESRADSYALSRYPGLALATAPSAYREAILIVAKKRLLARRGYSSEVVDSEYNDALGWLRAIAADSADLSPNPNGEDIDPSGNLDQEITTGLALAAPIFREGFLV